jgi:integrase
LKVDRPVRSYLDSARQIAALLEAAGELDGEAYSNRRHVARRATLATLGFSGVRLGELLALRWRDVDLADGWLYVGRSKTDAGVRRVRIRPTLRDELLELRANPERAQDSGALVFATSTGKPHSQSNVRRMMALAVNRANTRLEQAREAPLPRLSPHALRRTFASVMFALGESIPVVMADGGWPDPKVVLTVYAHSMRRDHAKNDALRELVKGSKIGSNGSEPESAPAGDQMREAR